MKNGPIQQNYRLATQNGQELLADLDDNHPNPDIPVTQVEACVSKSSTEQQRQKLETRREKNNKVQGQNKVADHVHKKCCEEGSTR